MGNKKELCKDGHDVEAAIYLTTCYTPHIHKFETASVAVHMFLCKTCGQPYSTHQEVPRSYLPDGSITQGMKDELHELRIVAEVDSRLKLMIAAQQQRQAAAERAVQGATKEGGSADGESSQQPRGTDEAQPGPGVVGG